MMSKPDWFCPLTKMDCNPRCVCYRPERTTTGLKSNNGVNLINVEKKSPEYCTNFPFSGNGK